MAKQGGAGQNAGSGLGHDPALNAGGICGEERPDGSLNSDSENAEKIPNYDPMEDEGVVSISSR